MYHCSWDYFVISWYDHAEVCSAEPFCVTQMYTLDLEPKCHIGPLLRTFPSGSSPPVLQPHVFSMTSFPTQEVFLSRKMHILKSPTL
jgi:hypothetical protein